MVSALFMRAITIGCFGMIAIKAKQAIFAVPLPASASHFQQETFRADFFPLLPALSVDMFNGEKLWDAFSAAFTFAAICLKEIKTKLTPVYFSALPGFVGFAITAYIISSGLFLLFSQTLINTLVSFSFLGSMFRSPPPGIFPQMIFLIAFAPFIAIFSTAGFAHRIVKMRTFTDHTSELRQWFYFPAGRTRSFSVDYIRGSWHVFSPLLIQMLNIIKQKRKEPHGIQ
jgi:hypothetical protein